MMIKVYKALMTAIFPLLKATYIKKRQRNGKEHPTRFNERLAAYTYSRPAGKLYWLHGASVGESISMLPLIDKLLEEDNDLSIMVTTGTLTSAEIMEKRLPKRAFHQFVPFDVPRFARQLIAHFKPDAVLWFESEFWPSILSEVKQADIPLILVNGRVSDKSFEKWKKHKGFIREILNCFDLCLGQSQQDYERLIELGAPNVECAGNLKYAGKPLPVDGAKLAVLEQAVNGRQVFLISSTHHNEEEQLAEYLTSLCKRLPDVLTIVVPRHPNRGGEIVEMFRQKGFETAQRSANDDILPATKVYVADTIGEMGLWYRLAEVSFIGGSLIAHGGQNFMEPARDNNAVLIGRYVFNFMDMSERALAAGALLKFETADEVIKAAIELLSDQEKLHIQQQRAHDWALKEAEVLDNIYQAVIRGVR